VSGLEEDRTVGELRRWVSRERDRARREATDHHLRETFPSHPDALPASPTFQGRGSAGRGAAAGGSGGAAPATITVAGAGGAVPTGVWTKLEVADTIRSSLMRAEPGPLAVRLPFEGTWEIDPLVVAWSQVGFDSGWLGEGARLRVRFGTETIWPSAEFAAIEEPQATSPTVGLPVPVMAPAVPTFSLPFGELTIEVLQSSGETQFIDRWMASISLREPRGSGQISGVAPGIDPTLPRYRVSPPTTVQIWTPDTDAWTLEFPTGAPGSVSSTWAFGPDAMFHFGGGSTSPSTAVSRYRPGEGWDTLPAPSSSINFAAASFHQGRLWSVGGKLGLQASSNVVRSIDPDVDDSWDESHAPIPINVEQAAAFWIGGNMFVLGGREAAGNASSRRVYRYNPAADTWTRLTDLPDFYFGSAVVVGERAYLFGQQGGQSGSPNVGGKPPWFWTEAGGIQVLGDLPDGVDAWHRGVYDPATNDIYLTGSTFVFDPTTAFWRYAVADDTYVQGPDLPESFRVRPAMLVTQ
jgi:hypothetical protein